MKKFGKKLARIKFRQAKIWREHVIRSEMESKPENIGSKKGPESEILRNSPEFRSEFPTKVVSEYIIAERCETKQVVGVSTDRPSYRQTNLDDRWTI
jgi:hypothetical protein